MKLATEGVKKIAVHRTGKSDAETTLSLIEAQGAAWTFREHISSSFQVNWKIEGEEISYANNQQ